MEDENEVTISAQAQKVKPRKYPGMSPLQAGLAYGGPAATVMGPLALLVGLGAGITAKRMRKSWLDRETEHVENMRMQYQGIMEEADAEMRIADPDEKRLIEHTKRRINEGWNMVANGDRAAGSRMIEEGNATLKGIMQGDMAARKAEQAQISAFQRNLVQTSAVSYRDEYQKNMAQFEDVNSLSDRVLKLAADAGFDPNKPFNKAVMVDLLTVGVGGLYRDSPDVLGSIPIVGEFLERGKDAITGKFDLTREDYNRIAMSMKEANELVSENRMVRLGEQARQLDDFARRTGAIPEDYSLGEYVTGGTTELRFTESPAPTARQGTKQLQNPRGLFSESETGKRLLEWAQKSGQKKPRPTN